jgi:hypothetical protein
VLAPVRAGAAQVAAALRPGGEVFFHDAHPVLGCLDAALRWRESCFREELVQLGEVVTSAVDAGLVVVALVEAPAERNRQDPRVPGEFLLRARKPAA